MQESAGVKLVQESAGVKGVQESAGVKGVQESAGIKGVQESAGVKLMQESASVKGVQESAVVIISITRYRDIDCRFIQRTISWRPYIVRYRARTHVSRVRCSHTAAAASASD